MANIGIDFTKKNIKTASDQLHKLPPKVQKHRQNALFISTHATFLIGFTLQTLTLTTFIHSHLIPKLHLLWDKMHPVS